MSMRARNIKKPSAATAAILRGEPAPSAAVVGEGELQRLRDLVGRRAAVETAEAEARREALRQASEARAAGWPNTTAAARERKLREREERLAAEEARRKVIDAEESALRDAARQRILDSANRAQYEQNDKVKAFTSKLLLASVLTDRERQIAEAAAAKEREKTEAAKWHEAEKELRTRAEAEEAAKLAAAAAGQRALRAGQLAQLEDIRKVKIAERDADRAEGQMLKARAAQALEDAAAAEAARRAEQAATNRRYVEMNDEQKALRDAAAAAAAEEEARIAEFARLKEQQVAERQKRQDERLEAKHRRRQDVIDAQATRLAALKAAAEERELKAARDFNRERDERERREAAARQRRQEEIAVFRKEQQRRKEEEEAIAAASAQRLAEVWRQRTEILADEAIEERRGEREAAERLQRFHLLQMQEKEQQALLAKRAEIEEGISLQEAIKNEEDMYENYVNAVMSDYVRSGKEASVIKKASKLSKN